jgi:nucleoid-associated protein YgaU
MGSAVNDLASGNTPPGAYQLATNDALRFDVAQPVVDDVQPAAEVPSIPVAASNDPPPAAGPRTYRIQEGDTLWSIASRELGDGKRHKELADLNRGRLGKDGTLRVGASILLPGSAASAQADGTAATPADRAPAEPKPATAKKGGKTVYTVRSGDTLGGIAARFLGSSSKYEALLLANADTLQDEDSLQVGMELTIPGR